MTNFLLQVTTICTFLLSYHILLPFTSAIHPTAFIRDENGEPLLNGGTYYMIRRNIGNGGGLTVAPNTAGTPCPLYVTQTKDGSAGLPVKISSHINSKYLPYGTTDFEFIDNDAKATCTEPLVWRLSSNTTTNYVAVGTPQWNDPSAFSLVVPFTYVEEWQFEINFCNSSALCGRVNVMDDNGLLAINNDLNFVVRFRKAFTESLKLDSII